MFDAQYLVDKIKPHVLLLTNIGGASFNIQAADYAYDRGIKVITLTAEGLFREKEIEAFIWGNDKYKKKKNWHKMFLWSESSLKMAQGYLPQYAESFEISGSTSIDNYKIYEAVSKEAFLKKYRKSFDKIITYAGFGFSAALKVTSGRDEGLYRKDLDRMRTILRQLVIKNKDVLFILKKHPDEDRFDMDVDFSWDYKNTLILSDQETLVDLISISDLLLVYRSSTSFEAYALGKPVINIFPSKKHPTYCQEDQQGNSHVYTGQGLQKLIEKYYQTGRISSFEKKKRVRQRLIKEKIYSDDGLNSWRTAIIINNYLKPFVGLKSQGAFSLKGLLIHLILRNNHLLGFLPRFKRSQILKNYNEFNKFYQLKRKYYPQIKKFYQKNLE